MRFFVAVSFAREKSHERASASDALWRGARSSSRGCLSDFEETEKKPETTVCGVSLENSRLATHTRARG
jgi:hypothetical protein